MYPFRKFDISPFTTSPIGFSYIFPPLQELPPLSTSSTRTCRSTLLLLPYRPSMTAFCIIPPRLLCCVRFEYEYACLVDRPPLSMFWCISQSGVLGQSDETTVCVHDRGQKRLLSSWPFSTRGGCNNGEERQKRSSHRVGPKLFTLP